MDVGVEHEGEVVVVRPSGSIDTRSSFEFEQRMNEILEAESADHMVIDCSEIEQLTSAGIRVLLVVAKRVRGAGGTLALKSPSDHVTTVLEISGLADMFRVVESATAVGEGSIREETSATPEPLEPSDLSMTVFELLGGSASAAPTSPPPPSKLSRRVVELLECAGENPVGSSE